MRIRQMAAAFLFNSREEVLFLRKNCESAFLPGRLVPVGDHIEPDVPDIQWSILEDWEMNN